MINKKAEAQYNWNGLDLKVGVHNKVFKYVNDNWVLSEIQHHELAEKAEKHRDQKYRDPDFIAY